MKTKWKLTLWSKLPTDGSTGGCFNALRSEAIWAAEGAAGDRARGEPSSVPRFRPEFNVSVGGFVECCKKEQKLSIQTISNWKYKLS